MTRPVLRRTLAEHIGRAQIVMYAAAIVLVTLGAAVVGYHYLHEQTLAHLNNLAQITAIESQAALIFGDDGASADVLRAIPANEGVTRAEIFDARGSLRAQIATAQQGPIGWLAGKLDEEVTAKVIADRHTIGEVRLRGGQEPLLRAFFGLIVADIVVVTCIGLLALFVLRRNARRIALPLTQLRALMHQATEQRDFTQRAPAADIAEVDDLRTEFNGLLDEIVHRDQVLRTNNQMLQRLAFHDPLTGLPNRTMFEPALAATLDECAAAGNRVALLYLDIDSFKAINDTFGHDSGDRLLTAIAERLSAWLPEGAMAARLGGDEFVVLIAPLRGDAERGEPGMIALIHTLRAALEHPVRIDSCVVHPGVSIGFAIYPDTAPSAATLLQSADRSMYQMKGVHYRTAAVTRWTGYAGAEAIAPRHEAH